VSSIEIKSVALNRVRVKSKDFRDESFLSEFLEELKGDIDGYRYNPKSDSLILYYGSSLEIIESNGDACELENGCTICSKERTASQKRADIIGFLALAGYSVFLFVKEHILGVAIVASPFGAVAVVALVAATPLIKRSLADIKKKKVTLQTFLGATLLLTILGGEAMTALEIITILKGSELLEEYLTDRSKKEIRSLIEADVKKVFIVIGGVELECEIKDLKVGDTVVFRAGEKIAVDGEIVEGGGDIDESLINGRSEPTFREIGEKVYAGTILESGRIYVKVQSTELDTYISRMARKVELALIARSPSEVEADRLAQKLLKLGTFLSVATLLLTGSISRAFSTMIVMSCPCSTVLAASSAVSAGVAKCAKEGVLIKGGEYLEGVAQSELVCFDKTGTLTTGRPLVSDVVSFGGLKREEIISIAASLEYRNTHPIGVAIYREAKELGLEVRLDIDSLQLAGLGVSGISDGVSYLAGNEKLMKLHDIAIDDKKAAKKLQKEGKSLVFVAKNGELIGIIALKHEVREGVREMLDALRANGVKHLAILSGDTTEIAEAFAKEYGFDEVYADLLPEEKADVVTRLKKRYNKVVMVGDGINDTLAMAKADIAVSFAAGGSEAAISASNIAITHSHPQDVVMLFETGKRVLDIVKQNYYLGTGTNLAGVALAAMGRLSPVGAGLIHIGHTVGIMANSSRLALGK